MDVGEAQVVHGAGDGVFSQTVHDHVGGGVIADDDHERQQVLHGRREAVVEED